ncbi:nucleoside triphosphate pyrophosphohydrolase family protein [Methylobacter sp. Wu1]|uniref:nucleoside triphosphate pyrophosphohydrolase family protein n=1 Tax=Methylobacter sp. Wu1 TaxID=3119359 RepID=UPI002F94F720
MKNIQQLQAEFMDACGQLRHETPIQPSYESDFPLWKALIVEESAELHQAIWKFVYCEDEDSLKNISEVCAEAVDLVYVTMGLMNYLGLPFMEMFNEIHAANMRKCVGGKVIKNEQGKVLKPEGWKAADKLKVIHDAIKKAQAAE